MALSWIVKISYSVGHVLNDLAASMWFSYLLVYLVYVLQMSPGSAGFLLFLGQLVDGLYTPIVGIQTDKGCCLLEKFRINYNPRKFWHALGTVCVGVTLPLLFYKCSSCQVAGEWALLAYFSPLVILFQMGWATTQVSHLSLIPDMSPLETERDLLNTMRYSFDVGSDVLVYVITWIVFTQDNSPDLIETLDPDDFIKFRDIVLIITFLGLITSIAFQVGTKVPKNVTLRSNNVTSTSWRTWLRNRNFHKVAVLNICAKLFSNLSQVYVPVYLQETLQAHESSIATVPLLMNISALLAAGLLISLLAKRVGKKFLFILGNFLGFIGLIIIIFLSREEMLSYGIYLFSIVLGPSTTLVQVTSLSLTSDLINTFTGDSAFVYGYMSFGEKIVNGLIIWFVQIFAQYACDDCSVFFTFVMVIGLGLPILLSTSVILTVDGEMRMVPTEETDVTSPLLPSKENLLESLVSKEQTQ